MFYVSWGTIALLNYSIWDSYDLNFKSTENQHSNL